jgi:hypothetical protein
VICVTMGNPWESFCRELISWWIYSIIWTAF